MADLFHTARVKVRRARKHIGDIGPELERVVTKHDKFQRALSITGHLGIDLGHGLTPAFRPPDQALDEIACCVGDAVHNLRSALDLLACEVVERTPDGNPNNVHFPFADTAKGLTEKTDRTPSGGAIRGKNFHRAGQDAQDLLLSLKPHGEPHGNALLWGLHRLDLIDKHRDLLALSTAQDKPGLYLQGVHLKPADQDALRLVFAQGDYFPGHEVVAVLDGLASEVERVIQAFSDLAW